MSAVSGGDARRDLPPAPVLVTGAGGCVGAWVLHRLAAAGVAAVGFDLSDDRRRLALLCGADAAHAQTWETGDIADGARVLAVMRRHDIRAVIHLAALQVPFCKAAPADGARVNVVGSINVFEAAREIGVRNLAYASSSSALAMVENSPWMETLYGAYKVCNEQTARVYWRDWRVASVGVRPAIIYGPGRDRGMSSKITLAMLAAVVGESYASCLSPGAPALFMSRMRRGFSFARRLWPETERGFSISQETFKPSRAWWNWRARIARMRIYLARVPRLPCPPMFRTTPCARLSAIAAGGQSTKAWRRR